MLLYRPSDEDEPGYYGVCLLAHVERDYGDPKWIWLGLGPITLFPKSIRLSEIYGNELTTDAPFYTYSRTLRPISDYEFEQLVGRQDVQEGIGFYEEAWSGRPLEGAERRWTSRKVLIRQRRLRDELFGVYGPRCSLTQELYWSLSGHAYETQVGHLVALEYGGPDTIQNALPMSATANWHWDNGLVSLTEGGRLLVSSRASVDSKRLFREGHEIKFLDSRVWPKAEYLNWHRTHVFEKGRQPGLRWGG
ncbi:MAG: hypothetical protein EOO81_07935 [Oxalobacteraceae bacterium]|nr:MAG: hypothetical protein EOO81_07935 [Oxalobacteraceae bacterium]